MSFWRTTTLAFLLLVTPLDAEEGTLDQLRKDVYNPPPPTVTQPGSAAAEEKHDDQKHEDSSHNEPGIPLDENATIGLGGLLLGAATSPLWLPHFAVGDNLLDPLSFQEFPYASDEGRMLGGELLVGEPKTCSWQWRSEYVYQSQNVHRIGGRLLVEGASRLGMSTEFGQLSEGRRNGTTDELWLGNCNLLLRFAQSERMQWRFGAGVNWLADHGAGRAGFNLTYGFDFFPVRPLVASTELDWGQVGHASLFRFRTTGGVVWRHIETYTGYEYLDIGSTQLNGLIGGLRLWY